MVHSAKCSEKSNGKKNSTVGGEERNELDDFLRIFGYEGQGIQCL